ncbi:MAG: hypothetical protein HY608_04610 [Planctomycetes bacterium]|nr:hypothetical protein [Planctomycetota bacterium]
MGSVGFFVWLSLHQAAINDARAEEGKPPREKEESSEKVLVWPDLVYSEFLALILLSVFLIVWAVAIEAPLEPPANPNRTPNPSKAPWYFLGLQEMLVYFDPWLAGVVFPIFIVKGLIAIPYIDRNPKGAGYYTLRDRGFIIPFFLFGFVILWVLLIYLGTFLRGPNWNFFGPFEPWDKNAHPVLNNVNLSEIFWVMLLNQRIDVLPEFVREAPGLLALAFYFGVGPALGPFVFKRIWPGKETFPRSALAVLGILIVLTSGCFLVDRSLGQQIDVRKAALDATDAAQNDAYWAEMVAMQKTRAMLQLGMIGLTIGSMMVLTGIACRHFMEELGFLRYSLAVFFCQFMLLLVMKMLLRWLLNLKYLVAIQKWNV